MKHDAGKRIELDVDGLALFHVVAIEFANLGADFHFFGIDHLPYSSAGLNLIAFAILRQGQPGKQQNPPMAPSFFSSATRPSMGEVTRILSMLPCA